MPRNFNHQEWETYVPDVDSERDLCRAGEPCITMEIKIVTQGDRKRYESQLAREKRIRKSGGGESPDEIVARQILADNVRNITNYSINGRPITDGADLYDRGDPDIIADAVLAINSRSNLDEGLAKKLSGGCGFSTSHPPSAKTEGVPAAIHPSILTIPETEKA